MAFAVERTYNSATKQFIKKIVTKNLIIEIRNLKLVNSDLLG